MTPLHLKDAIQSVKAGRRVQYAERLQKRLTRYGEQLELLSRYDLSIFGEKLGLIVNTPCLVTDNVRNFAPFHERAKLIASAHNLKRTTKLPPVLILHRCDNNMCINGDHIIYGSNSDNMRDALLKGRFPGRSAGDFIARRDAMTKEVERLAIAIAAMLSAEPIELVVATLESLQIEW